MKLISQSIAFLLGALLIILWKEFLKEAFTIHLIGLLLLIAATSFFYRSSVHHPSVLVFSLYVIILIIIFSTSLVSSSFFFLLFFLSFIIGFLLKPQMVFIFLIVTLILFIPYFFPVTLQGSINLFSLILISPLAFWFGKEQETKGKFSKIQNDTTEVIEKVEDMIQNAPENDKTAVEDSLEKLEQDINS